VRKIYIFSFGHPSKDFKRSVSFEVGDYMIMSDRDLKDLLKTNKLSIDPLSDDSIQQNGIDLTIGDEIALSISAEDQIIDSTSEQDIQKTYKILKSENGSFVIRPFAYFLLTTKEFIKMPNDLMAFIAIRSTFARLGFSSPMTIVDAGFEGTLTIGIFYGGKSSIKIPVGCRFLHLVFAKLATQSTAPYRGYYKNRKGVSLPKGLS